MKQGPNGKLRNRIFLVVLIGFVPVVVGAALAVSAVNDSHRTDVARFEAAVLTETAQGVQDYVTENILSHPRVITPTGTDLKNSTSAQQFAISETLSFLPYVESESFVNLNGQELTRADRANPNGYPASALRNVSTDPGFLAAQKGNNYVGAVSYGPSGPSIAFASPAVDSTGAVTGVIMGEASLDQVERLVAQASIGTTGYLYLVDTQGNVIGGGGPMGAAGGMATTSAFSIPIVQNVLEGKDLLTADTQMRYTNTSGAPVVAAAEYIPAFGWGLVAEWPTSEADAVVNDLFMRNALLLSIVLVIMFTLSLLLAAYIVRPIKKLRETAARVAQGKFNEGVYIKTGDEMESLGTSFNDMVQGLKQLESLKDEFVFIAAHELRTPVAAMKGYLTLILEGTTGAIPDATRQYIEKVVASDNRLVQLVNDLLEVARSQAGRLTIKVAPTGLAAPIRSTLDELKSLADEKSVKLVYESAGDLPNVMADADRIKEVMVNLVGNAIKYMGGAGTVTITHERTAEGLVTHVTDTGLGMSAEAQKRLFEKFYRVQTEKTRDITGTGLGLFIVREIIEKMGGKIWAASEEGKGSTFSFVLPVAGA